MKLIVFYSFRVQKDFDEDKDIKCYILVNAPRELLTSQFKDFVYENYFDKILNLETSCNEGVIYNLVIDKVEFIAEL